MYCSKCGNQLSSEVGFCNGCGADAGPQTVNQPINSVSNSSANRKGAQINPKEKKDIKPIWIYISWFVVQSVVLILAVAVLMIMTGMESESELSSHYSLILISLIFGLILCGIFGMIYRERIKSDFKRLTTSNIIYVLIITMMGLVGNYLAMTIFDLSGVNQDVIEAQVSKAPILMPIFIVIMTPFYEEVVFRMGIGNIIKNNVVFVMVSAILFGLIHSLSEPILLLYIFLGAIFSIIYIKTDRNLIAATLGHMINNLVGFLLILFAL